MITEQPAWQIREFSGRAFKPVKRAIQGQLGDSATVLRVAMRRQPTWFGLRRQWRLEVLAADRPLSPEWKLSDVRDQDGQLTVVRRPEPHQPAPREQEWQPVAM